MAEMAEAVKSQLGLSTSDLDDATAWLAALQLGHCADAVVALLAERPGATARLAPGVNVTPYALESLSFAILWTEYTGGGASE
jgi:hypothetical protein